AVEATPSAAGPRDAPYEAKPGFVSPVRRIPGDEAVDHPDEDEVALCLSGGGYRAMLYHVGALWRLNELGLLPTLTRVSSVSGGSIAAGVLALAWKSLAFDAATRVASNFLALVAGPLREMASTSVDAAAIVLGVLGPGTVS